MALAVVALSLVASCRCADTSSPQGTASSDWQHKSWKFSRDTGLPSTGWIEFEPDGRRGAIRVVDYSCSTEPRCRFEGTFKASADSIKLQVHPWENQSFDVRSTSNVMEWTRNGVVVERFTYEKQTRMPPPDPDLNLPIRCRSDGDCPRNLACGPCKPDETILNQHVRVNCTYNPCPGHRGYCRGDGVCAVAP